MLYEVITESYQTFKQTHEDGKNNRNNWNAIASKRVHVTENKNKTHEAKNDDMTCCNICKQTNHQDKRFSKYTNEFNNRHQRNRKFQPPGDSWCIKNMFPIGFISRYSGDSKCEKSQYRCYADIRITSYNVCYTKLLRPVMRIFIASANFQAPV